MPRPLEPRALLCAAAVLVSWALPAAATPEPDLQARVAPLYGKLPLSFEANQGQASEAVRFLGRSSGLTLYLTPTEAVLGPSGRPAVRLGWAHGSRHPRIVGVNRLPTRTTYLVGNDPRRWRIGVASYAAVRYEAIYPGVDLVFHGNPRRLEYDFLISPGGDPGRIRLTFGRTDPLRLGPRGELILHTPAGDLVQPAPVVYQPAGDRRQPVEGHYVLLAAPAGESGSGDGAEPPEVGFAVGRYDRARPLVIDPVLVFSTYLGGGGSDQARGIAVDGAGNAYVTGLTASASFPGVGPGSIQPVNHDLALGTAFVTKINAAGTQIVYSTFLGGSGGSDLGSAIAVDQAGNAYVGGGTTSPDFPGVSAGSLQPLLKGGADGFVTKLDPTGSAIVYSTFLGGSSADAVHAIAVDGAGEVFVAGQTNSNDFPGAAGSPIQPTHSPGFQDAFVAKLNAAGTAVVYATYLGGGGDIDDGRGIAIDGAGNAYVTGRTGSPTFPGVGPGSIQPAFGGGISDVFVTKINAGGTAIVYSTYLGGNDVDEGNAIAVDSAGEACLTGVGYSVNFPGFAAGSLVPPNVGGPNAFVTKIDAAGTAILFSTSLGFGFGQGIALDAAGNLHVTGLGAGGATVVIGLPSMFVTSIDAAGTRILDAISLGGSGSSAGWAIAVDGSSNAYVTGFTSAPDFPGTTGSPIQPVYGGGDFDAFVIEVSPQAFDATVPTLSPWGAIVMVLLLGGMGLAALRLSRRRASGS